MNQVINFDIFGYTDDTLLYSSIKPEETEHLVRHQTCPRDMTDVSDDL